VSTPIERLRYYDGEYLRSFDFETEQAYHVAMRRRLNRKLHLSGIVEGLILDKDSDSTPGAEFYSISAGMAIDQLGREMIVPSPYVFRREVDLARKDITAGQAAVWLCYRETPSTPPSVGYGICNDPDQNTRWREEYDVVLVMIPPPATLSPKDDPDSGRHGVRLGTVTIASTADGLAVTGTSNDNRSYVGIVAQSIVAPAAAPASFNILGKNSPTDPPASLEVVPILFADKSVIVGADFEIKTSDFAPGTTPPPVDPAHPEGYLKVANTLFLNGALYTQRSGKWFSLDSYVKSLVSGPDIQIGTQDITPVVTSGMPPNGTDTLHLTSTLAAVSSVKVMMAITSVTYQNFNDLTQWLPQISAATDWLIEVTAGNPQLVTGTSNKFDIPIHWSIGPKSTPSTGPELIPVTKLTVNYLVVFYPQ
jgi:hypothetical protein